jgi:8-hydroxy-5-deazaflavin:NADPH oxidoreductase
MNIGVIGTGQIGEVLIRKLRVKLFRKNGKFTRTGSRGGNGGNTCSTRTSGSQVDILFLVLPQKSIPELPKGLLRNAKQDTIVIDVGNYYEWRDGRIDEIEDGLTDSEWVQRQIDWPMVKVLNSVIWKSLAEAGRPAGSIDRVAFPISGDNTRSKEIVAQLLDRLGFDSVDAGTIAESWRQQPGSPVYCTNPTRSELKLWLKKVDRSSLAGNKEKGLSAHLSLGDPDYQTQLNAFRAIFR